jgi:murein L,D-transpeptidase YafK
MLAIVTGAALVALNLAAALGPRALGPLGDDPVDLILVDKSARSLDLIRDGVVVRRYPVALGFSPEGDKARQGDGRTPEGVFRIDRRNPQSRFHLSVGLDYPHASHRAAAAAAGVSPGGDIFIHGQPPGVEGRARIAHDWTDGCIAVTNAAMEEIWAVTPVGTRVEVRP